jgi:hypothetical protein
VSVLPLISPSPNSPRPSHRSSTSNRRGTKDHLCRFRRIDCRSDSAPWDEMAGKCNTLQPPAAHARHEDGRGLPHSARYHDLHRASMHLSFRFTSPLTRLPSQSFISALIFLVRTTSAGISSCEIQCKRIDYESGAGIHVPAPLRDGSKLPRLLELGAQFLFAVAPNRHHPARKHSVLLQMIREAGLGAETPHSAGSGSGTTPSTVDLTSAAPRLPPVPSSLPPLPTLPSQPQSTPRRQDLNGESSPGDSWMWSAGAGLPVSLDGGSLLIPSAPEAQAGEQATSSMASVLSSGDNPFFGNFCE